MVAGGKSEVVRICILSTDMSWFQFVKYTKYKGFIVTVNSLVRKNLTQRPGCMLEFNLLLLPFIYVITITTVFLKVCVFSTTIPHVHWRNEYLLFNLNFYFQYCCNSSERLKIFDCPFPLIVTQNCYLAKNVQHTPGPLNLLAPFFALRLYSSQKLHEINLTTNSRVKCFIEFRCCLLN